MKTKNFFRHLKTVLKHKWIVFKLSIKAGIPIRGILHDLSKFSKVEFFESVKYYENGKRSPLANSREIQGYSLAWLHHKGRNKHHLEYWVDAELKQQPIIPRKYAFEMICDKLSASMVYEGKNWNNSSELNYWVSKEKDKTPMNPKIQTFITKVFTEVSQKGIDEVITKRNLNKLYDEFVFENSAEI